MWQGFRVHLTYPARCRQHAPAVGGDQPRWSRPAGIGTFLMRIAMSKAVSSASVSYCSRDVQLVETYSQASRTRMPRPPVCSELCSVKLDGLSPPVAMVGSANVHVWPQCLARRQMPVHLNKNFAILYHILLCYVICYYFMLIYCIISYAIIVC